MSYRVQSSNVADDLKRFMESLSPAFEIAPILMPIMNFPFRKPIFVEKRTATTTTGIVEIFQVPSNVMLWMHEMRIYYATAGTSCNWDFVEFDYSECDEDFLMPLPDPSLF